MGREAHALRLALGRSADEPPDWPALADQFAPEGEYYVGIDPSKPSYRQTYDRKGRPVNLASRTLNKSIADASNAVLAVARVCETDGISFAQEVDDAARAPQTSASTADESDNYGVLTRFAFDLNTYWVGSIAAQLQVFPSMNAVPLTRTLRGQYHHLGLNSMLFAGLPCSVARLYFTAVKVSSAVSDAPSSDWPLAAWDAVDMPSWASWLGWFGFEYLIIAPLVTYTELQRLHLLPSFPSLPPLRAFNPFSPASPIHMIFRSRPAFLSATSLIMFNVFKHCYVGDLLALTAKRCTWTRERLGSTPVAKAAQSWVRLCRVAWEEPSTRHVSNALRLTAVYAVASTMSMVVRLEEAALRLIGWQSPEADDHDSLDDAFKWPQLNNILAQSTKAVVIENLTAVITWPFRAIVLRTLARAFLDAAVTPDQQHAASLYSSDAYPIFCAPISGFSLLALKSDAAYWSKVAICFGLKLFGDLGMCCLQGGIALFIGRRLLGWREHYDGIDVQEVD